MISAPSHPTYPIPWVCSSVRSFEVIGRTPSVDKSVTLVPSNVTFALFHDCEWPVDATLHVRALGLYGDESHSAFSAAAAGSNGGLCLEDSTASSGASRTEVVILAVGVAALAVVVAVLLARRIRAHRLLAEYTVPKRDKWEVPRLNVHLGDKIGEGAFSVVYSAKVCCFRGIGVSIRAAGILCYLFILSVVFLVIMYL